MHVKLIYTGPGEGTYTSRLLGLGYVDGNGKELRTPKEVEAAELLVSLQPENFKIDRWGVFKLERPISGEDE